MRRYVPTLVLLVVAAVLGAYLLLVDNPREREKAAEKERESHILDLKEDDLTALELMNKGNTIALERSDGVWRLTRPVADQVDDGTLRRLLTQLTTLAPVRKVDGIEDLGEVGLKEPSVRVVARTASGETAVEFGDAALAGSGVYVRRGDGALFLTDQAAKSSFEVTLTDLRRKEFLDFDPQSITAIRIARPGRTLHLRRGGEGWSIDMPPTPADPEKTASLLSRLRALKTTAFFDTPAERRAITLNATPKASIELSAGDRRLLIGFYDARSAPPAALYARTDDGRLYQIAEHLLTEMPLDAADLRSLHLVRVRSEDVQGLKVTTPAEDYRVARRGDDWELDGRPLAPDAERRVAELLDEIVHLKADSVAAESLADAPKSVFGSPAARIELEGSNQQLLATVTIGPASGEHRYAYSGSTDPVFLLDGGVLGRIPSRSVLQGPSAAVERPDPGQTSGDP